MSDKQLPWRKRQEIPDLQVCDAADQYDNARQLLCSQPPASGLLLPLLNSAIMAVELYLKSLASELIYRPEPSGSGVYRVYVAPPCREHKLETLLNAIPHDVRQDLEQRFQKLQEGGSTDRSMTICEVLRHFEGLFVASRYPFEEGVTITQYSVESLMRLSEFLRDFVATLQPFERISWK